MNKQLHLSGPVSLIQPRIQTKFSRVTANYLIILGIILWGSSQQGNSPVIAQSSHPVIFESYLGTRGADSSPLEIRGLDLQAATTIRSVPVPHREISAERTRLSALFKLDSLLFYGKIGILLEPHRAAAIRYVGIESEPVLTLELTAVPLESATLRVRLVHHEIVLYESSVSVPLTQRVVLSTDLDSSQMLIIALTPVHSAAVEISAEMLRPTHYLVRRVQPRYPESCRRAGIQGQCVFQVLVSDTGKVQDLIALKFPHDELLHASWSSMKQWLYKRVSDESPNENGYQLAVVMFKLR